MQFFPVGFVGCIRVNLEDTYSSDEPDTGTPHFLYCETIATQFAFVTSALSYSVDKKDGLVLRYLSLVADCSSRLYEGEQIILSRDKSLKNESIITLFSVAESSGASNFLILLLAIGEFMVSLDSALAISAKKEFAFVKSRFSTCGIPGHLRRLTVDLVLHPSESVSWTSLEIFVGSRHSTTHSLTLLRIVGGRSKSSRNVAEDYQVEIHWRCVWVSLWKWKPIVCNHRRNDPLKYAVIANVNKV